MMVPTFDERASTLTKSLLADAERVPRRRPNDRTTTGSWKAVTAFAATVIVISGAIVGVSIALRSASVAPPAPARPAARPAADWKSIHLLGVAGGLSGVACLKSGYCVAFDQGGDLFTSTDPGGGANAWVPWVNDVVPPCCRKSGASALPSDGGIKVFTTPAVGVSCAVDPTRCVVVGQSGDVATTLPQANGALGTLRIDGLGSPDSGHLSIAGISCDLAVCFIVGGFTGQIPGLPAATNAGYVATYTETGANGGSVGGTELPGASALTAVSCPSHSFCVAADGSGDVLTSTVPGGTASGWTITHAVLPAANSISAISCPTVTFCAAITRQGDVVTSTDPTGRASAWRVTRLDGTTSLDSISCLARDFCIVGGPAGAVFVSHDPLGGSSAWVQMRVTVQSADAIVGVSCPNTSFCVGVDGGDDVHVYTNPNG